MSPSFASCTRLGEPSPKWPRILPNGRFIIGWPAWFQFYSGSFSGWIPFSRISNFYGLRIINYCGWKKSCTIVDHRHPIMGCLPPFSTGDLDFATIHSIFHVFSLWSPIPLCFFVCWWLMVRSCAFARRCPSLRLRRGFHCTRFLSTERNSPSIVNRSGDGEYYYRLTIQESIINWYINYVIVYNMI